MFYKEQLINRLLIVVVVSFFLSSCKSDSITDKSGNVAVQIPAPKQAHIPAPVQREEGVKAALPPRIKPSLVNNSTDDYSYLNQIRIRAGMSQFSPNSQLETAALNHAKFLAENSIKGHYESEELAGFTGVKPKDRTSFAGYRSLTVSENISLGNSNIVDSINGLMGAIYHRLIFLNFVNNEVGIAAMPNPHGTTYVYNMGNSGYNALCQGQAFSGAGRYYFEVCKPEINIDASNFEKVTQMAQANNPKIVMWPADGDNDIPPAFFEETPDPLPDYSVSGYPISIQFNPLSFSEVDVTEFKLYRDSDNSEISNTRLLTEQSDPNEKLSALQYVLFPLERLDWGTIYRVEARYTSNLGSDTLNWRFKTISLDVPLFTVQGKAEVISIPENVSKFAVYVPPTSIFHEIGQINYSFYSETTVESEFKDANTLLLNLFGEIGQEATFSFSGGRSFVVRIGAI